MRLWSIDPGYLDPMGLVALWREGLLAQKVLLGQTRGYRAHPQLARFRAQPDPVLAIGCYLSAVVAEASRRGYRFDASKVVQSGVLSPVPVRQGQLDYEWEHLLRKLAARSPAVYDTHKAIARPRPHPLFTAVPGGIEEWERV
ncbi:MAG: pyrimidine dimer DNA glycosylase/endonuclease V [Bacillota bacterium]